MTAWADGRLLVALDIDGTILNERGHITDAVISAVQRLTAAGHEVMLATGRSVASALPVLDQLGIAPEYVVCSNGAITMKRAPESPMGYRREFVETFDPTEVLTTIRSHLEKARYAVEDETGFYRYTEAFPDNSISLSSEQVSFDGLLGTRATRVVVISPDHEVEDFLDVVDRMGLHKVSYTVGWTAWLDIAPDGVNKATAMERVREILGAPASAVVTAGDGRNDIEMLAWSSREGRGFAMGQAPDDVIAVASAVTGRIDEDGLATALNSLPA